MRVLVVPAPDSVRVARAAVGLALRGHEVDWWGDPPPEPPPVLRVVHGLHALWSLRADVVVGDASRIAAVSLLGWQVGARSMVLELEREALSHWSHFDRWAWHTLHAHGLIAPESVATFRDQAPGIDPDRVGLWPDAVADAPEGVAHPDVEILERSCERSLARQRGRALRPAVFVDRDGTLVREVGYLAEPGEIEILPGVPEALRRLAASGYAVVVISNQSGVARGLFPLARVYETMARLRRALRTHRVELDGIYFCPHAPDAGCPCRKPQTGLLERAAEDLQISLRHSVMVGDKRIDAAAGHGAGARGVLVRTGYGRNEEREIAASTDTRPPDAVVDDLAAAANWILTVDPHELPAKSRSGRAQA